MYQCNGWTLNNDTSDFSLLYSDGLHLVDQTCQINFESNRFFYHHAKHQKS